MKRLLLSTTLALLLSLGCQQPDHAVAASELPPEVFAHKSATLPMTYQDTSRSRYTWLARYNVVLSVLSRIPAPAGSTRVQVPEDSWGWWLRRMQLKPGRPDVLLYDGSPKGNQNAHHMVLDIPTGTRDLQQCADAVMRLRAEYLFARQEDAAISFKFTSGDPCPWSKWQAGQRPQISGNKVSWVGGGKAGRDYPNFQAYLSKVFTYAGTASLSKELKPVADPQDMQIGDVWIQGGFPGHAVIVMDLARDAQGHPLFLLAQSYMPAQDMHILRNPSDQQLSPWYRLPTDGTLQTPEWTFSVKDLKRF
jgi:Domain of unknown function (4846)